MATAFLQCIDETCRRRYALDASEYRCEACGNLLDVEYEMAAPDRAALLAPVAAAQIQRRDRRSKRSLALSRVTAFHRRGPERRHARRRKYAARRSRARRRLGRRSAIDGEASRRKSHGLVQRSGNDRVRLARRDSRLRRGGLRLTGNTSASMSAYAMRAGMKALVFVPAGKITAAKLAQALEFGAMVIEIAGNFDQAFHLLRSFAKEMNLYLVNSLNPFRLEGQKTIIFELLERRGWRVPDYVVVPGGNLGNVSAMGKGLCELRRFGFIDKLPRLVVTQAEGANPFCRMLAAGATELTPVAEPHTEATAIRIGNPVNWKKALRVIRATNGLCESVSDAETFEAKAALAHDGIGCEPASATTLAGIRKLRKSGKIEAGADVVAILTGNQLKDSESSLLRRNAEELARQRVSVEADAGKLRAALEKSSKK